jgi:hypothetical protein
MAVKFSWNLSVSDSLRPFFRSSSETRRRTDIYLWWFGECVKSNWPVWKSKEQKIPRQHCLEPRTGLVSRRLYSYQRHTRGTCVAVTTIRCIILDFLLLLYVYLTFSPSCKWVRDRIVAMELCCLWGSRFLKLFATPVILSCFVFSVRYELLARKQFL